MNLPAFLTRMRPPAHLLLVLLSAMAAAAAYLQALNYPFISDDVIFITNNHKLADLPLAELWRLFTEPYNNVFEFLPLRDLSFWFDMALFGLAPSAFRMHNILLYLLCLPLVYGTTSGVWRYFRPADAASAPWAAAIVTALFALHPTLVESVVWISGRKYVLPLMFSMLALWFAVHAKQEQKLSPSYAAATLVAFVAVMFSKASFVAVAPAIALLWVVFWRGFSAPNRRYSLLLWPLALLFLAGFMTLTFIAYNNNYDRVPFYFGVEAVTRSLAALGWLARLTVSPESRHYLYPVFEDPHLYTMVALGVAVLAAAAAGAVMMLRRRSLEGFALTVFLLSCIPYMQLIPNAPPSLVSDRYAALAVWPVMLLIVALSWRLKPLSRTAILLAIALAWGFQTLERPRDWRSFEALVDADLRTYPGHYLPASYKIIELQLPRGLFRDAGETANTINAPEPRNAMIRLVYADNAVYVKTATTGNPHEAMERLWDLEGVLRQPPAQVEWNPSMRHVWGYYQKRLTLQWNDLARQFPDDASVRYHAGLWMLDFQKYEDAVAHLRAATESQHLPESVRGTAFKNLGLALINSGHIAEAEAPLRAALDQSQPDLQAHCLLSEVYKQAKRYDEAARAEADCRNRAPNEETQRK